MSKVAKLLSNNIFYVFTISSSPARAFLDLFHSLGFGDEDLAGNVAAHARSKVGASGQYGMRDVRDGTETKVLRVVAKRSA
jgi:hypothetical protein